MSLISSVKFCITPPHFALFSRVLLLPKESCYLQASHSGGHFKPNWCARSCWCDVIMISDFVMLIASNLVPRDLSLPPSRKEERGPWERGWIASRILS